MSKDFCLSEQEYNAGNLCIKHFSSFKNDVIFLFIVQTVVKGACPFQNVGLL